MDGGDGPEVVVVVVHGDVEVIVGPVAGRQPDLDLVDRLARLQLAGRRLGRSIRLRHPTPELCQLIELVG